MEQADSEKDLTYAMLVVKDRGEEKWRGAGRRGFALLPRIGEYVEPSVGEDKQGYLHRVVAVVHAEPSLDREPYDGNHGFDVYAVQVGRTSSVISRDFSEAESAGPN